MSESEGVRAELARLMTRALLLGGKSKVQVFQELLVLFDQAGLKLTYRTFDGWLKGECFPSSRKRQLVLADALYAVTGNVAIAHAIKALQAPPFRGYRRSIMKETEDMAMKGKGLSSRHIGRSFPVVTRLDEAGKPTQQARIICAECGAAYHHLRRGDLDSDQYFRRKGWEVGNNERHDFCPKCVEARRKVVKMSDHLEKKIPETSNGASPPGAREMTKEDGRLLFKAIEAHWDDNAICYQPGWSDVKVAEAEGVPVAWVKTIRERDYGGVGDDPTLAQFVADQVAVSADMALLAKDFQELSSSVAHVDKTFEKYRERHNALSERVKRLGETAARLAPPFSKAG